MKIIHDEQPKKTTRPCTFADVPIGGVFERNHFIFKRITISLAEDLEAEETQVGFYSSDPVTYYPEATLHLGRAVTEVEV